MRCAHLGVGGCALQLIPAVGEPWCLGIGINLFEEFLRFLHCMHQNNWCKNEKGQKDAEAGRDLGVLCLIMFNRNERNRIATCTL